MNLLLLDSGHAKNTPGKNNVKEGFYEWEFNNDMQYRIKKRAEEHGIHVYLSNPDPAKVSDIGLTTRANKMSDYWRSKGKPKSIMISLHGNAYSSESARGTETYHASNASNNSKNFAKILNDEVYATFKKLDSNAKNRGVKCEDFTVIYKTQTPAILVEYGFYSNLSDLKIMKNNRNELCEATIRSICKYFAIDYKPVLNEATNDIVYQIITGGFGSKDRAETFANQLIGLTGWYMNVNEVPGYPGDYRIETGGFTGENKVKAKLNALMELTGWWATYQKI